MPPIPPTASSDTAFTTKPLPSLSHALTNVVQRADVERKRLLRDVRESFVNEIAGDASAELVRERPGVGHAERHEARVEFLAGTDQRIRLIGRGLDHGRHGQRARVNTKRTWNALDVEDISDLVERQICGPICVVQ